MESRSFFKKFATTTADISGHAATFAGAITIILIWAASGPMFGFSDTWQLVINTGTTIITFLMVFLIQNTQNRDTRAMQIKLDELIRATQEAHNALLDIEELDEKDLKIIRKEYEKVAADARKGLDTNGSKGKKITEQF